MKVCLVTDEYPPQVGGVGVSVQRIALGLRASGVDVVVAVLGVADESLHTVGPADAGIPVVRFGAAVPGLTVRPRERAAERSTAFLAWAHEREFDLFHCFFPTTTGLPAGTAARLQGTPLVASFRGNDLHYATAGNGIEVIGWVLRQASHATVPNEAMRCLAKAVFGSVCPLSVLRNGVDIEQAPHSHVAATRQGIPTIGTAGVLRRKKGIHTIIEAARRLLREREVVIVLIGDFPLDERSYWLAQLGDEVVTEVTGILPHVQTWEHIARLDVFVHASLYDGCPNAVLEAAAVGRPLLCSRIPAHLEILREHQECLCFDVEDAEELAAGLRQLIDDHDMAERLGGGARARVAAAHSLRQERDAVLEIYRSLQ